jgi:putative ABC transport system substrate-binding protein
LSGPDADLEKTFETIRQGRADAVVALEEPAVGTNAPRIAALAIRYRLPAMFTPLRADAGFLLAYGTSVLEGMRAMAPYIDKILKGAKPGDLPVTTLRTYSLTVNQKTARALGLAVPRAVLDRANHVIE